MSLSIKKSLLLGLGLSASVFSARADKGMWLLNELSKQNLEQMKNLGFQLSADSLYSLDKASVANAVVIFGGGCSGVTVSRQGLIMTNHHCGYDAIQSQSTVQHDYLRDGFVSQSLSEELPIAGLEVRYLSDITDVTPTILKRLGKTKTEMERLEKIQKICQALTKERNERLKDSFKEVEVKPYYAGNKYYMITYDVFKDVRMVFAPPSSIGKFGGDTDNWMWPRHTGDFSVFRVYANQSNKPALYSKDNVPYTPKYVAAVSAQGYQSGDYAMTIGFPGSTSRYIPSWGIESRVENSNNPRIEVRGIKQDIWRRAMEADQATGIKYATKYAHSSNYWKNSIGMNRGLEKLGVVERKRAEEEAFEAWVKKTGNKSYVGVLDKLQQAYQSSGKTTRELSYLSETMMGGTEVVRLARQLEGISKASQLQELDRVYGDYLPSLDAKVLPAMLTLLRNHLPQGDVQDIFAPIDQQFGGNVEAYAEDLFTRSIVPYYDKVRAAVESASLPSKLKNDPAMLLANKVKDLAKKLSDRREKDQLEISRGNRLYFAGRREMSPERLMPSDANFTMRMSYGSIKGYSPADAVEYNYYTTTRGLLEKYNPQSSEFDLKPDFLALIKGGDWGRWRDSKSGELQIAFLSTNDITGGNSGSPVFDKNGRVIGLAFDGNWEAMSGDVEFEPELQRTISVDIRYVLFVIDKWGKCPRLIEELDLR